MTRPQLFIMVQLRRAGWPKDLFSYLLRRSGATLEDWQGMVGLTEERDGRFYLNSEGKRELKRQKACRKDF